MSISVYALIIGCIIVAFSFRRSKEKPSFFRLDQTGTVQLKGIAILLVLLSHLANLKLITLPPVFKYSGAWGVALFLILSGYGLTQSYLRDGIGPGFAKRRFKKVIMPYTIITALWMLIGLSAQGATQSLNTIMLSFIGFNPSYTIDPTMWFVMLIVLWYLVFYIIFKLPINDILKISGLFVLAYIFKVYAINTINTEPNRFLWQCTLHAYAFPVGVLFGLAYRRVSFVFSSYAMVALLAVAGIVSTVVFEKNVQQSLMQIDSYSHANIAFAFMAITAMTIVRSFGLRSRPLLFFGFISYEIYLLEWILMVKLNLPNAFSSTYIGVPVFLAALIVAGIGLHYIMRALTVITDDHISISFVKRALWRCRAQICTWTKLFHLRREKIPALKNVEKEAVNN